MAGVRLWVAEGDTVEAGQRLLAIEAMKMENEVRAPHAGTVESIAVEPPPPQRRVFSNRTLNLRSIKAIGFDMDYTVVHYRVEAWERQAFKRMVEILAEEGFREHTRKEPGHVFVERYW